MDTSILLLKTLICYWHSKNLNTNSLTNHNSYFYISFFYILNIRYLFMLSLLYTHS